MSTLGSGERPFAMRDYAFLADGERGILIGPRGEMAWMSFPAWDSPSIFSSLLGGAGQYRVTPTDDRFVWGGYYDESTLIWNSRWIIGGSIVECREALAFPGDPNTAVILRRITAVRGAAQVSVDLDVVADYGRRPMTDVSRDGLVWTARSDGVHLRWRPGPGTRRSRNGALTLRLDLEEGDRRDLVLELSTAPVTGEMIGPDDLWSATEASWREATPVMEGVHARRDALHAFSVMRGLTTSSGAMVAAASMGLPERAEAGRNYDYRYAWIRDQCVAGQAAAVVPGAEFLLDSAVRFVAERLRADGSDLKPAYRANGDAVPDEQELSHLPGYPGGSVKLGNWVNQQFQLDALGEALLLFAAAARADRLDQGGWKAVEIAVDAITERWETPDAGIWELDDHWWTHSRLACVTGLRQIASVGGGPSGSGRAGGRAGQWSALADVIAAETAKRCTHPSGRWQRAPDDERVDAALIFPLFRGTAAADDPRNLATLAAIEDELSEDGYLYRFRHDDRPLAQAEGTFALCGFALALAYERLGRRERAIAWFERNRASCGPPGLLSEEFDVSQRQLRGNIPQAFVHAMLLECAARISID